MSFVVAEIDGLAIDSSGAASVCLRPASVPEGFALVERLSDSSTTAATDTRVITSTKEIQIMTFHFSGEDATKGASFKLYYAPSGVIDGVSILLSFGVANGATFKDSALVDATFTGDGTAAIIMSASALAPARQLTMHWRGFEET